MTRGEETKKRAKQGQKQKNTVANTSKAQQEPQVQPVTVRQEPASAVANSEPPSSSTQDEGAVRNLSALFASTPLFPKKRKHPDARDVVRSAINSSRQRGLPMGTVPGSGGPHSVARSAGDLSEQEAVELMQVERMQVALRVRPLHKKRGHEADSECLYPLSGNSVYIVPPEMSQGFRNGEREATFSFSRVFGPDTGQEYLFRHTARNLVMNMVNGERDSAVVMTYGITSSGKTYTMEGTKAEPGIIMRSVELLFQELDRTREDLSVRVSLYEVYNDSIYDLLAMPESLPINGKMPSLKLKEDSNGHVFVAGLADVKVEGATHALEAYRKGISNRRRAETQLNLQSSRSHSIFTLTLCGGLDHGDSVGNRLCSMSFVDLAGSERAGRTGNAGARLREMVAINSSLMTLGRCLEALRWNQQHPTLEQRLVPYRESKVTHIFRDVLHGWGRVVLVTNVGSSPHDYDETVNVLKYAAIASTISTVAKSGPLSAMPLASSSNTSASSSSGNQPGSAEQGPKGRPGGPKRRKLERAEEPPAGEKGKLGTLKESGWEEDRAQLQAEVDSLQQKLVASETEAVSLETQIREEVSQEMQEVLRQTEDNFKTRLAAEVAACEEKYEKRLQIVTRDNLDMANRGSDSDCENNEDASSAALLAALAEERDSVARERDAARAHAHQLQKELEGSKLELEALACERDEAWRACKVSTERMERVNAEREAETAARNALQAQVDNLRGDLRASAARLAERDETIASFDKERASWQEASLKLLSSSMRLLEESPPEEAHDVATAPAPSSDVSAALSVDNGDNPRRATRGRKSDNPGQARAKAAKQKLSAKQKKLEEEAAEEATPAAVPEAEAEAVQQMNPIGESITVPEDPPTDRKLEESQGPRGQGGVDDDVGEADTNAETAGNGEVTELPRRVTRGRKSENPGQARAKAAKQKLSAKQKKLEEEAAEEATPAAVPEAEAEAEAVQQMNPIGESIAVPEDPPTDRKLEESQGPRGQGGVDNDVGEADTNAETAVGGKDTEFPRRGTRGRKSDNPDQVRAKAAKQKLSAKQKKLEEDATPAAAPEAEAVQQMIPIDELAVVPVLREPVALRCSRGAEKLTAGATADAAATVKVCVPPAATTMPKQVAAGKSSRYTPGSEEEDGGSESANEDRSALADSEDDAREEDATLTRRRLRQTRPRAEAAATGKQVRGGVARGKKQTTSPKDEVTDLTSEASDSKKCSRKRVRQVSPTSTPTEEVKKSSERLALMVRAAKDEAQEASLVGQTPCKRLRRAATRANAGGANVPSKLKACVSALTSTSDKRVPSTTEETPDTESRGLRRTRGQTVKAGTATFNPMLVVTQKSALETPSPLEATNSREKKSKPAQAPTSSPRNPLDNVDVNSSAVQHPVPSAKGLLASRRAPACVPEDMPLGAYAMEQDKENTTSIRGGGRKRFVSTATDSDLQDKVRVRRSTRVSTGLRASLMDS